MEDLHCSLGDHNSFTDPVTNRVMISGVTLERDLAGMLMAGRYPQRLLPTFLHEIVHHWCFHSPVGTVLSYLQLRARRNALLSIVDSSSNLGDVDEGFEILLDLLRYEAAVTLMRPLAEGMALFAEFDAKPGDSETISTPLSFTYLCFHEIKPDKAPFEGLAELLARHRLGDEMRERKANLLVQPFICEGGGYLPGYMLVKNLWLYMLRERKCSRFWDRDVFLSYLRNFFYADYEFIATVLAPETSEYRVTNSIAVYCQRRLKEFMDRTNDDVIREFEAEVIARENQGHEFVAGVLAKQSQGHHMQGSDEPWPGADLETSQLGRARLHALFDELNHRSDNEFENVIRQMESWLIAQRELMCIGSFREYVRVNEHGMLHVGHAANQENWKLGFAAPILALKADEGVPPQEGEGLIEFFLAPTSRYRAMAITVNGKRVATSFLGAIVHSGIEEQFKANLLGYTADPKVRDTWKSIVSKALEDQGLAGIVEHYREQIRVITNEHYRGKALLFTSDQDLESCMESLRENGLFDLLESNPTLVRGLAALSLAASVLPVYDFVKDVLAESGIDMSALMDRLREASTKFRLPIVRKSEQVIISYL